MPTVQRGQTSIDTSAHFRVQPARFSPIFRSVRRADAVWFRPLASARHTATGLILCRSMQRADSGVLFPSGIWSRRSADRWSRGSQHRPLK